MTAKKSAPKAEPTQSREEHYRQLTTDLKKYLESFPEPDAEDALPYLVVRCGITMLLEGEYITHNEEAWRDEPGYRAAAYLWALGQELNVAFRDKGYEDQITSIEVETSTRNVHQIVAGD